METFELSGITLAVHLDTRRVREDLTFLVKYRVTYHRKRVYYSSGIHLTEDQWKALPTTRKAELIDLKRLIQKGFDLVKQHIKEMVEGDGFTFEGLKRRLSKGRTDSLLVAFKNKIYALNESNQIGTGITYQCALNSISLFIGNKKKDKTKPETWPEQPKKDLKFSEVTVDWLRRYENHLLKEDKTRTTIKFYIGCIRAIMNEAKQEKSIIEAGYPFGKGKFEIKTGIGRKLALTLQQIKAVKEFPLLTDSEKRCRDLWFFSYLCNGINFNDMLKLKYKDIAGGEIHFIRQKTKRTTREQKEIVATLLPEMKAIIDKWGNPKHPDNYIFPFLHKGMIPKAEKLEIQNVVRLVNKKMARISEALNYDKISTYTARHSYATVLKRSGANIAFISESLGHSDLRTTEAYLASFETEERAKNASKLVQF